MDPEKTSWVADAVSDREIERIMQQPAVSRVDKRKLMVACPPQEMTVDQAEAFARDLLDVAETIRRENDGEFTPDADHLARTWHDMYQDWEEGRATSPASHDLLEAAIDMGLFCPPADYEKIIEELFSKHCEGPRLVELATWLIDRLTNEGAPT